MKNLFHLSIILIGLAVSITSCTKESTVLDSATLDQYYPLTVGKTFLYRLDSTVPASFGTALVVKSYQAKDSIESTFNDNEGRLSYRIFRYTRDTAGRQPWIFASTYVATPTTTTVEYVDNNMRFLKLHAPVVEGYTWKAHSFIDTKSLFTTVGYLDEWNYEYQNLDQPYTVYNKTYDSTVTIMQQDETTPPGPFDPNNYQQKKYAVEVYAKGVGLIYKDFLYWTWQTTPPPAKFEDGSYGVKLQLISHN